MSNRPSFRAPSVGQAVQQVSAQRAQRAQETRVPSQQTPITTLTTVAATTPEALKDAEVQKEVNEMFDKYHESNRFYRDIGFPQYGGMYEPFSVPEGYKVSNISESEKGLDYTLEKASQPSPLPSPAPSRGTIPSSSKYAATAMPIGLNVGSLITPQRTLKYSHLEKQALEENPVGYVSNAVLKDIGLLSLGIAPQLAIPAAAVGAGVSEAISLGIDKKSLSPKELVESGLQGAAFASVGSAVLQGIVKIPKVGVQIVSNALGRAGINTALGGGTGYLLSGGNVEEAKKGALYGLGFSIGLDVLGRNIYNAVRARLPQNLGGVERLRMGEPTIGSAGQRTTVYESTPQAKLQGKRLRIIADVTENPIGTGRVTGTSLIKDYLGKQVTTAHATLNPKSFALSSGGETILRGYPVAAKGFRDVKQLYHFYSAPSTTDVTAYGGYMGVGKGYSGSSSKVVFSGKPSVLVTFDTLVDPLMMPLPDESISAYLTRFSRASGKTGLAPETVLGKSLERQLETPAAYTRFGEELVGSKFVSTGKLGSYQIKEVPTNILGRVPIIRDLFSRYTTVDVYGGRYAPVGSVADEILGTKTVKELNVKTQGESVRQVRVDKSLASPAVVGVSEVIFSPSTTAKAIVGETSTYSKGLRQLPVSASSRSISAKSSKSFSSKSSQSSPSSPSGSGSPSGEPSSSPSSEPSGSPSSSPSGEPSSSPSELPYSSTSVSRAVFSGLRLPSSDKRRDEKRKKKPAKPLKIGEGLLLFTILPPELVPYFLKANIANNKRAKPKHPKHTRKASKPKVKRRVPVPARRAKKPKKERAPSSVASIIFSTRLKRTQRRGSKK